MPHALRTKCARCTKIQKDKALDVITRLYYQYPSIYLALAERYDPKGEYTKNFENWFDEQQKEKLNGQLQNELPQRPRIPSTWITSTTSTTRTTTERTTSMRTLRTLPTVRTTSGIIRIIPTTITERPSTIRSTPTTERITTSRSVPTTISPSTTTFLITTPRTLITVRPSTFLTTTNERPSTILTTTTQKPSTSKLISLSTARLTTLSTTFRPQTTTSLIGTDLGTQITTSRLPSPTKNTPLIRNDPPPFIPMKIPSSQIQFRPVMSSPSMFMTNIPSTSSARPIIQQQPFPVQSFQSPMPVNNGFIPSNTQNSPSRFPTASVLQVQTSVANKNPFSVPLSIPREPSVPVSTFRTPSVQRPPQQRPLERPLGPLPIDVS